MRKFTAFVEDLIGTFARYTRTERGGIILIILVVALLLCGITLLPQRSLRSDYLAEVDRLSDSLRQDYYQRNFARNTDRLPGTVTDENQFQRSVAIVSGGKPTVYIELNSADSAKLCTVRGIGPVISRNIVGYRERLGGFARKEQLKEVWGITDENFDAISAQFFIDPAAIQKIDINFASANSLRSHPYFTGSMVHRITEVRQLKGGWNTLRELTDNDILLPDEARRVAPYVVFGAH